MKKNTPKLSVAEKKLRRAKTFLVVAVLTLTAVFLTGGISTYLKTLRDDQVVQVQNEIAVAEENITTLMKKERIFVAYTAWQNLNRLLKKRVFWSTVIGEATSLKPENIFYRSYSAQVDGKINISALGNSYFAVADLLDIFQEKTKFFQNPFVPAIARGVDAQGEAKFSFSLNADLNSTLARQSNIPRVGKSSSGVLVTPRVFQTSTGANL